VDGTRAACLPDAIRKARLLPIPEKGMAPELRLGSFLDSIEMMDTHVLRTDREKHALISMDITPEELKE
jgi:hypothetical protein